MKNVICLAAVYVMAAGGVSMADTIRGINMEFVTIANAGNEGDARGVRYANPYGCGAVSYNYCIGKYEVTNAQWDAFTAAAGAPTGNDGDYSYSSQFAGAQQPANNVSWYEVAQFCNYLTSGDKSKGAYQFSGNNTNPGSFLGIDRVSSISTYGTTYVIPTEDEWYKAAYFKPGGDGYSLYANGTNTAPIANVESNYTYDIGAPWNITNGTQEQNGTFNMMGNVWEWTETPAPGEEYHRRIRGGAYNINGNDFILSSNYAFRYSPSYEIYDTGFRIVSIPEPCTLLLLGLGGLLIRKR